MEAKKNKKHDLERFKISFFQVGLIIALVIILAAFNVTQEKSNITANYSSNTEFIEENVPITVQEPPKEIKIPLPQQVIEILQIVDDETDIEIDIEVEDQDVDETMRVDIPVIINTIEEDDDPPIDIPDVMPKFPGGDIGLIKYLSSNVKYPNIARENGLQEKVYIRFCVTKKGLVDRVSVLRGTEPILYKEALRVIKALPKWKPGEKNGKKVSVWYTVPINFQLN